MRKGQSRTPKLPYFDWTGIPRPYPISKKRGLPDHIDQPDWALDGIPKIETNSDLQHVVEIKTPDQIGRMRETCRVKSYCGHGIGELFHCAPNIPHYAKNKAVGMMKAGQTFNIEPMINAGNWRDRMWPDGWTAVTADGKGSAQFEHTLLVT